MNCFVEDFFLIFFRIIGRRKIGRIKTLITSICKYCNKSGHVFQHCKAKETGLILHLHNMIEPILGFPTIPANLIMQLRNKAPPLTMDRIRSHYDAFDILSDDELDTDQKGKENGEDNVHDVDATTADQFMDDEDLFPLTSSSLESSVTPATFLPQEATPEKDKIYCNCGLPNDPSRPMICCDFTNGCTHPYSGGWYHYSCVGLTDEEAENMITAKLPWICRHCEVTEAKRYKKC